MLIVQAPAKVNLILEVLGKYEDNYHQILSIVQTINLYDTLKFELAEAISFKCSEPSLESDNLVIKAAILLKKVTEYSKGAKIKLCKRIPWGVGLGGGSSDAAAALSALNKLWGLELSTSELLNLASKLGSDVPFFIHGGTALVEGRGEKISPLLASPTTKFVLLVPPLPKIPNKTKQLYDKLNVNHYTAGQFVHGTLASWAQSRRVDSAFIFNIFEKVIFDVFPQLEEYKKLFEDAGASNVHLAGSGPALFTLVDDEGEANKICSSLEEQRLECYAVFPSPKNS
jgi:4-diphosphocytidyl-2-C-methyl-D-erythritol kinase